MVVLFNNYVQNLEYKAIGEALTSNLAPETYRLYVMTLIRESNLKNQSREFQNIK